MSEIKIDTSNMEKPGQSDSVKHREPPDVHDVNNFQALLSDRVEGDRKKDAKRGSKNDESNLGKSNENPSIFGLFFSEKAENFSKKNEIATSKNPVQRALTAKGKESALARELGVDGPLETTVTAEEIFGRKEISEARKVAVATDKTTGKTTDEPKKDEIAKEILTAPKEVPIIAPLGEKILDTLGQVSNTPIIISAGTISKIGNEIIERLMVIQSVGAAKQEVVIVFKENVLPGTQASIVRDKSELSLVFTTVNAQSMEFLATGHDGLRSHLLEQLKDITTVHIKFEERESGNLGEKSSQRRQQNQQSQKENDENTPQNSQG
jgi:hypothetical protein